MSNLEEHERDQARITAACQDDTPATFTPNGLPAGETLARFVMENDITSLTISPVRDIAGSRDGSTEYVVCTPEERALWSIYGETDGNGSILIHDIENETPGQAIFALCNATGLKIGYHAADRTVKGDVSPAELAEIVWQWMSDDTDDAAPVDAMDNHPLSELRESLIAALDVDVVDIDTAPQATANDPASWLAVIWHQLEKLELTDDEQNELNTAMAWVKEDLGLDDDDDRETCQTCGDRCDGAGDGYDGRCPSCADQAEIVSRSAPRWAWDVIDNLPYPNDAYRDAMNGIVLASAQADDEPIYRDDDRLGSV